MQVADAKELDRIVKEINECIMQGAQRFLRIGQLLKKVKDEELWQLSEAISFSDFAEKAVHLKKSQAYAAISVYEKWGKIINSDPQLSCVDPSRLVRLLPYANNDDQAEELIHFAVQNDAKDFEETIRSLKGTQLQNNCDHDGVLEDYSKCLKCGKFLRVANGK